MSTIKINELATSNIALTDFFAKADATGLASKNTVQELSNLLKTVDDTAFKGSIAIADVPSVNGWYFASESGTYTNCGGLVINTSSNISIIIISGTFDVFNKIDIPVNITIDTTVIDGSANAVTGHAIFDALALKAPLASPTFTGTVGGIDKTMVGLPNVDNTSDVDKPISTATQTAIDNVTITTDAVPTEGSANAVESGGVYDFIKYNKQINTVVKADSYPSIPSDSVLWESYPKANLIVNIGFVYQPTVSQSFNFISARIWSALPDVTVTAKIYKSNKLDYQFDPTDTVNTILLETLTFTGDFNFSEDKNLNLLLSESHLIDANEFIYVDFYNVDGALQIYKSVIGNQKLLFREETYGGGNPYWSSTGWKSIGMTIFNQDNENFEKTDLVENPNIDILIPDKIHVAVGRELNIFKDNLISKPDNIGTYEVQFINTTFNWTSTSDNSGINQSKRALRFTPTTAGETWNFEVSVLDAQRKKVAVKNIEIITVSKTVGSGTINVLNFGDSITDEANGAYTQELKVLFDADGGVSANMIGTKLCLDGISGYEGYSGRTLTFFLGSSSPFWNGTEINFQDYCTDNGFGDIDFCQFMLGTNDVLSGIDYKPDYDDLIAKAKSVIDKLLSPTVGFPSCKILVGLEGLGAYKGTLSPASRDSQILKSKLVKLNNLFIKEFQDGTYNSSVDVSPNHIWLDRTYGYPHTQVQVSSRSDASDTELTYSDSVHQNSSGSKQYSDSIYSNIRNMLS